MHLIRPACVGSNALRGKQVVAFDDQVAIETWFLPFAEDGELRVELKCVVRYGVMIRLDSSLSFELQNWHSCYTPFRGLTDDRSSQSVFKSKDRSSGDHCWQGQTGTIRGHIKVLGRFLHDPYTIFPPTIVITAFVSSISRGDARNRFVVSTTKSATLCTSIEPLIFSSKFA